MERANRGNPGRPQEHRASPSEVAGGVQPHVSQADGGRAQEWRALLETIVEHVFRTESPEQKLAFAEWVARRLRRSGVPIPPAVSTPYINTIPAEAQPVYPGNRELERRIKSYIRWNAMAMVVNANRKHSGIGGHISTFASSATLYEV